MARKSLNELVAEFMEKFTATFNPDYFRTHEGENFMTVREEGKVPRSFHLGKKFCIDFLNLSMHRFSLQGGSFRELQPRILDELNALVLKSGIVKKVHLRIGRFEGEIIIDRNAPQDNSFVTIHIGTGFSISQRCPIDFWQQFKQLELPLPKKMDIQIFYKSWSNLFNFEGTLDHLLLLAYVVKALAPDSGACPLLILEGCQGSGKSTTSTILKKLIDPSKPPLMSPPTTMEDITIAVKTTYLMNYDNLSFIKPFMADIFCTVSTGGGVSLRKFYTRDEEEVFDLQRPVIFNGIEELTSRPDFIDRALILRLKPLDPSVRKSELELWNSFEQIYPQLLGGLYDLTSKVLEILPSVQSHSLPRMTEYARFGIAIEKVLQLRPGIFLESLNSHIKDKNLNLFYLDNVCQAISEALRREHGYLVGTASELLRDISPKSRGLFGANSFQLPKSGQALSSHLGRKREVLKMNGIEFGVYKRTKDQRILFIKRSDVEVPDDYEDMGLPL